MGKKPGADERFERLLRQLGFACLRLQQANDSEDSEGRRITDVRFKLDADNRTSVLVILKAVSEDGPQVAFAGAADFEGAVIALGKRLEKETLRWRADQPWEPS